VGDLIPDLIVGEPLQLPGCAVGDESVLADVDRADHGGDQLFLSTREGAVRHRAPRGPTVRPAELRDGEEDPAHLRDEIDLEPRLRRFAEPLILGGQFVRLGHVNDLHGSSHGSPSAFAAASVRTLCADTRRVYVGPVPKTRSWGDLFPERGPDPFGRLSPFSRARNRLERYEVLTAMGTRLFSTVMALLTWGATVSVAQIGTAVGPRDGTGLPPTDVERVAVGSLAPDFSLESKAGATVTLSDFRGRKNVVLVFYRGHWRPYCTAQLGKLRTLLDERGKNDAEILAVAIDSKADLQRMADKISRDDGEAPHFVFLSDPGHRVIDRYGIWNPAGRGWPHPATY